MSRATMVAVLFLILSGVASAGPNAGGVIFVHNASVVFNGDMCGQGSVPASCENANTELYNTDTSPRVWKVYAAFKPCTAPRLKGVSFGITYSDYQQGGTLVLTAYGPCIGDLHNGATEFRAFNWPASGGGDLLVWQHTQTSTLVEVYWFAGYSYPYGAPSTFVLGPHPDHGFGGMFADDSAPAIADPIAGYGTLGFNQPGSVTCPPNSEEGGCCHDEVCTITCETDCQEPCEIWMGPGTGCDPAPCYDPPGACCIAQVCYVMSGCRCNLEGGEFHGIFTNCNDPNECAPVPVQNETWGRIKARYR